MLRLTFTTEEPLDERKNECCYKPLQQALNLRNGIRCACCVMKAVDEHACKTTLQRIRRIL